MSKSTKGLVRDIRPVDQPAETYPYGKNGIQNNVRGAVENEPGFRLSSAQIPFTINGIIETSKFPVIFSTNNVNSCIGYFDQDNDTYTPILDDRNLTFKLRFNTSNYITGTAQRDYLARVVVAFTDKNIVPMYLNCDAPNVKVFEDLLLFPTAQAPDINVTTDIGGSLLPGAYFAAVRYLKNDGTQTAFLVESGVTIISGTPGTIQNIALIITLTNVDPNFDLVEVAIISKINGVFNQELMEAVQLAPLTTISFTGANPTSTITLAEVLQNAITYNKIGTIGQLNDYLYVANVEAPQEVSMQNYANLVQLRWASELHNVFPVDPIISSGTKKSFMHREVYAIYIQYSLAAGGWSRAFDIPGRALLPQDRVPSATAAIGSVTAKTFQVEDTILSADTVAKTGTMGAWENADELYPDTPEFDSSGLGGENLRGKPVRHHRFPSLNWCKKNLYQYEPNYCKTKMDLMGLQVSNVIIPAQYTNQITGYRILYAKRNSGNSTVIAQSLYMEGGRSQHGYLYDPSVQAMGGPLSNYLWAGGNWFAEVNVSTAARHRPIYPDHRIMRFHAFDLLLNQPSISPSYICNELKMQIQNIAVNGYMEDGDLNASNDGPIVLLLDYLTNGNTPVATDSSKLIRKVNDSTYVPCNLVTQNWTNTQMEGCFGMTIAGPELIHMGTTPNPADDPASEFSYMKLILHKSAEPPANIPQFENSYLTNLMFLRDNLYDAFTSQDLVIANSRVNGSASSTIFGGDVFINDYTFNAYGWIDANNDGYTGLNQPTTGGIRVARRFACESASNIALRFITPGNDYSKYYPASPLVKNDITNYLTIFNRTSDPNQFGYTKDSNTLNELVAAAIFSPLVDTVYQFPYRIHRGGFLDRLNKRRNWRSFDPLDFYEMQKNMGVIIFIDGQDDRLLIHCEKALFRTQDKTKLESALIAVTLGAGDIFQFQPQESMASKLGYGGTINDLACVRTPIGYIFIDAKQGQVFMLKDKLELINEGMNTFLRDALRLNAQNVFTGNGFTIGYDPYFKRILMTSKNQQLLSNTVKPLVFVDTPDFIAGLTPGVSIVFKDGRLQKFLGVNSTQYACDVDPIPAVQNYVISVPDNTAVGTQVLQVAGVNTDDFYILSGNVLSAFSLNAASGRLIVSGPLNFQILPQYILQCKATNDEGFSSLFTITINILSTVKPPVTGDQTVHIPEHSPVSTPVTQVQASDPTGLPLTYAISSGNTNNAFTIDGNGNITVLTPSAVDFATSPQFVLPIAVSNGTYTVTANITIDVDFVNQPPSSNDVIVTIIDTTPNGTQIVDLSTAVVDSGVSAGLQSLSFQIALDLVPGLFGINLVTGAVTVTDNSAFNAQTTPQYIIQMRALDNGNPPLSSFFRLIINIIFDPATLAFAPAGGSCSGGTCPAGWVLSPDGLLCIKTTSVDATPPSGPQIQVAPATNSAYSNFGMLVYNSGYSSNGVGTIGRQINSFPWNNPSANFLDGGLNRAGVWGATAVPDNQPIGFSIPFTVPSTKTYYVAIAGDNMGQIGVDGTTIITQDPTAMATSIGTQLPVYAGQGIAVAFKFWHCYPVTLQAGTHYLNLQGINQGGPAGFGAEIYDATPDQLQAAQLVPAYVASPSTFPNNTNFYSNITMIFSTRYARLGYFTSGATNGYTCALGYGLDPTQTPPQCVLTQTQASSQNQKQWASVAISSTRTSTVVATLNNVIGQTFQGIPVPYYAPVINHIDCGGTIHTFLNVQQSQAASKSDCTDNLQGSLVTYYVQAGRYMNTAQDIADTAALTDAITNAPAYANLNGTCS